MSTAFDTVDHSLLLKGYTGMEFVAQLMNGFQVIYLIANSMFILMGSNIRTILK